MALKQQLHQKQVQKLILSPALQQAIKLLPLTNLELIEIIDEELSQNPVLEIEEETSEKETDERGKDVSDEGQPDRESRIPDESPDEFEKSGDQEKPDYEMYFQEFLDDQFRSFFYEKKDAPVLENFVAKSISLWDHLNWQANLTFFNDDDKEIAQYIIGNIDEDGYLTATVEEIAEEFKVSLEAVEAIRSKIRFFDPVGVGSLGLREALASQMEYFGIKDEITTRIVEDHLPLLEKSDYGQLTKTLGLSMAKVKAHLEIIKSLNPTPGRKYSQEKTTFVVPDIIVRKEDGEIKITLNDEGLPRLRISRFYKSLLAQTGGDNSEAQRYLKDKMKKAFWFMRSLDQRNKTIYKVANYIVDKQKDFIERGIEFIKPLTLIEIAQEIGVHESTVGRVVSNKYIMTPRGMFPLKYFFHKSLSGDYGEEISSLRVKDRLRKLVENEDRNAPLSDIEIGDILAKENFRIARRTVAKYRKQLNIPPSHIRKRNYMMEEA